MDLIIVNQNINYAKSLREYCSKSSKFKNVIIFRNLKDLLEAYIPKKGVILFEVSELNNYYLEKFDSNSELTIVAFCNENVTKNILKNVSSAISQNETSQKILEQLELIIDGKRILPKNIFDEIKPNGTKNIDSKPKQIKFNRVLNKLFN